VLFNLKIENIPSPL